MEKVLREVKERSSEGQSSLDLDGVKRICSGHSLVPRRDWYCTDARYKYLHEYLDRVGKGIFIGDCTEGLPADTAVTGAVVNCGSIFVKARSYQPKDRIEESVVVAIKSSWVLENKVGFIGLV
ncbi:MAG: hypothetical protein HYS80_02545 [Candidatus Aenigmarchaeota archaeon]|nr:hypothetical protein [Candidatus Aenigmarchaeota archaeon]